MHPRGPNHHRDRLAGTIADGQYGMVEHGQLRAAGLSLQQIKGSLAAGRLRPAFHRVYAVGHEAITVRGWLQAALLTCGDTATLGCDSACLLWRMSRPELFPITVITEGDRGRKQDKLRIRRMQLHRRDWMTFDGLRVTTPARTIVDMAATLEGRQLRRLVERAQDVDRFDPRKVDAVLERNPSRPGCRPLSTLIALLAPDEDNARSYLERLFLQVIRKYRLPLPEVNREILGRKRDFVWPDARLVVEVDGYANHSSKWAIARDKRRDRELTAALWRPARFTYEEIAFEPEATGAELRRLLSPPVGAYGVV
jgi:very-short-patch-repair endonuclease